MVSKLYRLSSIIIALMFGFAHANEASTTLEDLAKSQAQVNTVAPTNMTNANPIMPPNIGGPIPLVGTGEMNNGSDRSSGSNDSKRSKYFVLSSLVQMDGQYMAWAEYGNKGFSVKPGIDVGKKKVKRIDAEGVHFVGSKKVWKVGDTINAD